jgi:hypothetical protein
MPWSRTDPGSWRTLHVPRPNVWTNPGCFSFWEFSTAPDPSVRRRMAPSLFPSVFASATLEILFVRIAVASAARAAVTGSRMIASSAAARLQSRYGFRRSGQGPPHGGGALRGAESGAGKARFPRAGLALVQRSRASGPTRRRTRQRRAATRQMQRTIRRLDRLARSKRGDIRAAWRGNYRPPPRIAHLPGPTCDPYGARSETEKARAQAGRQ